MRAAAKPKAVEPEQVENLTPGNDKEYGALPLEGTASAPSATELSAPPAAPPASDAVQSPSPEAYTAKARSFARFRLAQNFDEVAGVSKIVVHISVVKPGPQAWFRVHTDPAFRMQVALLNLRDENEVFIVDPALVDDLAGEISPHLLYTFITRQGVVGLWPARLPRSDGKTDGWMRSSHEAAELGMKRWVRMQASRSAGSYEVHVTKAPLSEPEWPDITFEKLLELGFADHVIDTLDHPVLCRLRGEV